MSCEPETVAVLREAGHKMTPQRMMILTSLRHAPGHLTAGDIHERIREKYPYVDISTVYRTLGVLKDLRLVSETDMGTGDATFEWVAQERHHHLICRKCERVDRLDHHLLEELAGRINNAVGFHADIDHFAIFGLCASCQSTMNAAGGAWHA